MSQIIAEISPQIQQNINHLVQEGWFKSVDSVVEDALRRYLESHSEELLEKFIKEDVEWGLYGKE